MYKALFISLSLASCSVAAPMTNATETSLLFKRVSKLYCGFDRQDNWVPCPEKFDCQDDTSSPYGGVCVRMESNPLSKRATKLYCGFDRQDNWVPCPEKFDCQDDTSSPYGGVCVRMDSNPLSKRHSTPCKFHQRGIEVC